MFNIYKITNEITGKIYIGQTYNIYNRLKSHKACRDKSTLIVKSITKHGWDNHKVEILFESEDISKKLGDQIESYYIRFYNSYCKYNKNGMNLNEGEYTCKVPNEQVVKINNTKLLNWLKQISRLNSDIVVYNKNGELISKVKSVYLNDLLNEIVETKTQMSSIKQALRYKGWCIYKKYTIIGFSEIDPMTQYYNYCIMQGEKTKGIPIKVSTKKIFDEYRSSKNIPVLNLLTGVYFDTMSDFCSHEQKSFATIRERFERGRYIGRYLMCKPD